MNKREIPAWVWGVLGVLIFAWFAYWIGRGK